MLEANQVYYFAVCLVRLAKQYILIEDFQRALDELQKSLLLFRSIHNEKKHAQTNGLMIVCKLNLGIPMHNLPAQRHVNYWKSELIYHATRYKIDSNAESFKYL